MATKPWHTQILYLENELDISSMSWCFILQMFTWFDKNSNKPMHQHVWHTKHLFSKHCFNSKIFDSMSYNSPLWCMHPVMDALHHRLIGVTMKIWYIYIGYNIMQPACICMMSQYSIYLLVWPKHVHCTTRRFIGIPKENWQLYLHWGSFWTHTHTNWPQVITQVWIHHCAVLGYIAVDHWRH